MSIVPGNFCVRFMRVSMCWIPVEEYFFVRNIGLELIDLGKFSDIFLGSVNCSVSVDDFFFFFFLMCLKIWQILIFDSGPLDKVYFSVTE